MSWHSEISQGHRILLVAIHKRVTVVELAVLTVMAAQPSMSIRYMSALWDGSLVTGARDGPYGKAKEAVLPFTRQGIHKAVAALCERGWIEKDHKRGGDWRFDKDPRLDLRPLVIFADAPAYLQPSKSTPVAASSSPAPSKSTPVAAHRGSAKTPKADRRKSTPVASRSRAPATKRGAFKPVYGEARMLVHHAGHSHYGQVLEFNANVLDDRGHGYILIDANGKSVRVGTHQAKKTTRPLTMLPASSTSTASKRPLRSPGQRPSKLKQLADSGSGTAAKIRFVHDMVAANPEYTLQAVAEQVRKKFGSQLNYADAKAAYEAAQAKVRKGGV